MHPGKQKIAQGEEPLQNETTTHAEQRHFRLARGQIARINAVHIGDPGIKPIELTMQFLNASGATVAQNTKTVPPLQAISFDYEFAASLEGNRQELRVLVGARGPANPDKHLRITIEVFDADTGKNTIFYGNDEL